MGLSNYIPNSRLAQPGVCTSTTRPASKCCTKCNENKSFENYYESKNGKYGLMSWCKQCHAVISKKSHQANPEISRKATKKYKLRNTEKTKEDFCAWYAANRTQELQRKQKYREQNRDKLNEQTRNWYRNNPKKYSEYSNRRRARLAGSDVRKVTNSDIAFLMRASDNSCVYCKSKQELTLDHVVPLVRGGRHSIGNLVVACMKCNMSKNKKFVVEWKRLWV